VISGWSLWSEYGPCIQQHWGNYHCTRVSVRICMGTSTCRNQNRYGVEEKVQDCKIDLQLAKTCTCKFVCLFVLIYTLTLDVSTS